MDDHKSLSWPSRLLRALRTEQDGVWLGFCLLMTVLLGIMLALLVRALLGLVS